MRKQVRRSAVVGAAVLALAAAPTAAFAHECYNASRSDQGNAGAAHAPVWETVPIAAIFAEGHLFLGGDPLTETQVADAVTMAAAQGIPTEVTIFVGKKTIGQDGRAYTEGGKAVDGQGIDWFFAKYESQLVNIFLTVRGDNAGS